MMRPFTPLQEQPPSANVAVARLRLRFSHLSLRELETRGVLNWDRDEHVVEKGEYFDTKWDEVPDRGQRASE